MDQTAPNSPQPDTLWTVTRRRSPIVATAIHDGGLVAEHLESLYAINAEQRLREEDPFTARFIPEATSSVVVHRSRFELDLNRPLDGSVYLKPEQAWGLTVWREHPDDAALAALARQHHSYYAMLGQLLSDIGAEHGAFIVLDLHSYNHRRDGALAAPSDQAGAPDINIGTFSMDRARWAHVLDPFIDFLGQQQVAGKPLDVRENIAFAGKGEQTRFIHERFPENGCAIAVEFKKIFMDEWTGEPLPAVIDELSAIMDQSIAVLRKALTSRA